MSRMKHSNHLANGRRAATFASLLVVMFASIGCSGSARFGLVSLNTRAIDPPRVEPFEFSADECYWWTDDSGNLRIALHARQRNLFLGKLGVVDIDLSLCLDKPPAGLGRDYPLHHHEPRVMIRSVMQTQRFASVSGIASVLVKPRDQMHGSFRILLNPISEPGMISILPAKPGPVLCYGTFRAVHDAKRGAALLSQSDASMSGNPAASSRTSPGATTRPALKVQ
ncbi:MAG: hypothetical protein IT419_11380 [Planctomycetes bacterium]|nr:hypothetical protein [Planctomycetota bacterium]